MKTIKNASAILFDLDGTLFDLHIPWNTHQKYVYNHYSRTYNAELPQIDTFSEMFEFIGQFQGEEARLFYENYLKNQELIAIKERLYTPLWLIREGLGMISLYIRYDTFFGIVSSNFHESILEILELNGLKDRFKVIIGRDDVKRVKPHPEGLIRVCDEFELFLDQVLFIGNSPVDEEAASRAQIHYCDVKQFQKELEILG